LDQSKPVVGRLAPSPTGALHVGHARTFLIAWLAARSVGGKVVLRIEDLDASRTRPWAVDLIQTDLRWLGLDWDEGPYVQSQRQAMYDSALERLKARELVYPCICTRADIARAASAPHADEEGPIYPGTCSHRSASEARTIDRPFAWRFRVPPGEVAWDDALLGPMSLDPVRLGADFVVGRSSGEPSYQLAVVVDDAAMGVTQVVRGDDLVPSTPRQLLLYAALGLMPPTFAHVPLVVDEQGRRLAKRDESIKLATLRDSEMDPRRLVGILAHSCGWADETAPTNPQDWTHAFDLTRLPRTPWVFPRSA
jgi:glutamyl-tRNA synthetase